MRPEAVGGPGVEKKTPTGELATGVDQLARDDGVEAPRQI